MIAKFYNICVLMFFYNKKKIKENILVNTFLFIIILSSLYLSFEYSYYNTDFLHWSFILEKYYQFINNQGLFKEIYIQYGEGYIWFFYILSFFFEINLVSIGKITGVTYALNLILIFFISKYFSKNSYISLLIILIYYLLLTHIQIPWPDFFASFFLTLFILFFILANNKNNFFLLLSSFLLFLVFIFRTTYIVNILFSFFLYFFVEYFFLQKKKIIRLVFIYFLIFISLYVYKLYLNDDIKLWFYQSLGSFSDYADDANVILGFQINNYLYKIIRLIWHLSVPKNVFFFTYSLLFLINIFYLLFLIKNCNKEKNKKKDNINLIILILFFGLSSIIQALHLYETFRLLNAGASLFIISSILLSEKKINLNLKKILFGLFILLLVKLITYFPKSSNYHATNLLNKISEYEINHNNNFFGEKRLNHEYIFFYKRLNERICPHTNIINFSSQKELSFFCPNKKKILKTNPQSNENEIFLLNDIDQLKNYYNNQDIVIISNIKLTNYNSFFEITLPGFYRFTKSDTYMAFYSNKIYLYKIIWP
jgi:hypothetical protein